MKKIFTLLLVFLGMVLGTSHVVNAVSAEQSVVTEIVFKNQLVTQNGKPLPNGKFTFILTPEDPSFPLPKEGTKVTVDGEEEGRFSNLTYTTSGKYTYILSQEDNGLEGYIFDQTKYRVTVLVSVDEVTAQLRTSIVASEMNQDKKTELLFKTIYTSEENKVADNKKVANNIRVLPQTGEKTTKEIFLLGVMLIALSIGLIVYKRAL
ncbi:Spy0128 family protein [Streptococcus suis]|uniref:Spy0128 family protein n=1 Tax=Streptococcus suis TaxID=1307 RepID=UPI001374725E|nr:FctA domain-containing protein [Streptococcus suis]